MTHRLLSKWVYRGWWLVSLLARCRCGVAATLTQPSSDTSFVNVNLMILDSGTNIAASILCAANKLGFIIIGKGSVFSVECQSLCHRGTFIFTRRLQWQGHLLPSQWRTTDMLKLSPRTDLKWWTSIIIGANWVNVLKEIYRNGEKKYRVDQVVRNKHVTRLNCSRSSVRSN